jgi:hypothetical protein
MSLTTITVTLPERLYRRLQSLAQGTNRPISEVLVASAEAALPVDSGPTGLPPAVADELAAMRQLSDQTLWNATRPTLTPDRLSRLDDLMQFSTARVLSAAEQNELNDLLAEYDRSVLRRAQAFALLSLRGYPIPDLNKTETI